MSQAVQCHVIRITPRGRGAVASLILVGRDALAILEACLVFPISGQNPILHEHGENSVPVFAHFRLGNSREETILHIYRQHMIELHCHGGDAVVNAIETALVLHGAESQSWQDWVHETQETGDHTHHKPFDMFQREALHLLPYAETELTAQLLLAQYHGALSRRMNQLNHILDNVAKGKSLDNTLQEAITIIDSLLMSYESGRHLTTPFRVGLIGPVNVGKSSLMNAMVGFNRSITSPVAGTTRDTVSAKTIIAGWPFTLIDTAGIRETSTPVEQEGISRVRAMATESDLLLQVTDACDDQTCRLPQVIDIPPSIPILYVVNKIDLITKQTRSPFQDFPNTVPVSALTGVGLDQLYHAMMQKLHKSSVLAKEDTNLSQVALVFTERQYAQLLIVRNILKGNDILAVCRIATEVSRE